MALIELVGLIKIFGPDPKTALARLNEGWDKERLLIESGHVLGLSDISLEIQAGETFVIMGLSGSGKSTLVRCINRLVDPTAGVVRIDGTDVTGMDDGALRAMRRRIGMVFQRFALMPHRTVLANAAYGLEVQGVPRRAREAAASAWLARVGLAGYERHFPRQLSGGMQQRVGLARALAGDADILLMDEAFSALDPLIRRDMQDQVVQLQRELRKTIVFITHDLDEALRMGDRIAILRDGALIQVDTPERILLDPVDDYVDDFVRDVNRARVLTAGTIQTPATLLPRSATGDQVVAATRKLFYKHAYIVDEDGRLLGVVSADSARKAGPGPIPPPAPVAAAEPGLVLTELLPLALRSDPPIAVVDADGRPTGIVSRKTILRAMSRE